MAPRSAAAIRTGCPDINIADIRKKVARNSVRGAARDI
jgi:hypothetical protein